MRKPKATRTFAGKLCAIRLWKGMSQSEILRIVFPEADRKHRALVSQWERAKREPGRQVIIRYARLAAVSLEDLLPDENDLPARITKNIDRYKGDVRIKRRRENDNNGKPRKQLNKGGKLSETFAG